MKEKQNTHSHYEAKLWTSDKLVISFWYPEELFDVIYEEVKKCLNGGRNELWLGNYSDILEIHLEDWSENHYYSSSKDIGISIPWNKVVMWDLTASELENQPIK